MQTAPPGAALCLDGHALAQRAAPLTSLAKSFLAHRLRPHVVRARARVLAGKCQWAVVALLRDFQERMANQIFACGGTIEKYIGDEIFAVFGLPSASPHDAINALRCAGLMLQELDVWNKQRTAQGELPLSIGIGLNYGPAVMGDVGTERSLSFTVIGDTVNVASRLQSLTRELKTPLVVADPVIKQIGRADGLPVALKDGGERELRGRSAAIRIWTTESA